MRRRLEVDFAGDCGNEDGESLVVCSCGLDEQPVDIRRFTRCKVEQNIKKVLNTYIFSLLPISARTVKTSLFGGDTVLVFDFSAWSFNRVPIPRRSFTPKDNLKSFNRVVDEWRVSKFLFGGLKAP